MLERRAAAVVLFAAGLGLFAQYLLVGERPGLNIAIATALFLAAAWHFRRPGTRLRLSDAWLPGGAFVLAASCAVRTDVPLVAFDAIAALGLSLGFAIALRRGSVTDLAVAPLITEALALGRAIVTRLARTWPIAAPVLRALVPARSSRATGYAAGLGFAVPFLVVFGALFSAADAVFQRTLSDALDLTLLRDLFADLPPRVIVAAVVAWLAGGAFASLADPPVPREATTRRILGVEPATAMLLAIDALFASFVVLQVAYLFGGRDTLAASGIPYSTYARRGFFELVAVAAVVAAMLFGLDLALRARGRAYVAAALLLIGLTLAVLASAAIRMNLYQQAYGWTELRFYASAAIAFLGIALLLLAWAVLRSRMAFAVQRLVIAGLAVAIGVNAIGPSGFIARANIARFVDPAPLPDGSNRDLDLAYLLGLGDGALPAVVEALPSIPEPERARLEDLLRLVAARRPPSGGWQSWNLDRQRAGELLALATSLAGSGSAAIPDARSSDTRQLN